MGKATILLALWIPLAWGASVKPALREPGPAVRAWAHQIEALSGSEPLVLGAETRLNAAAMLMHSGFSADRLLQQVEAGFAAIPDPEHQAKIGLELLETLLQAGFQEEAERVAAAFPRDSSYPGKAEAYGKLVLYWLNRDRRKTSELIMDGFRSGAYRNRFAGMVIQQNLQQDPAEARALFAVLLGAFRPQDADWRDVQFLIECARGLASFDYSLAFEALDRMWEAVSAPDFGERGLAKDDGRSPDEQKAAGARQQLQTVAQLRQFAAQIGPKAVQHYEDRFAEAEAAAKTPADSPRQNETRRSAAPDPERELDQAAATAAGLPDAEALAFARQLEDPLTRAFVMAHLAGRQGLPPSTAGSLLQESLQQLWGLPATRLKVLAVKTVADSAGGRSEPALQSSALQVLAETTADYCACEDEPCRSREGRLSCSALYATLLPSMEAAAAGGSGFAVPDVSLQARLLLKELPAAIARDAEAALRDPDKETDVQQ